MPNHALKFTLSTTALSLLAVSSAAISAPVVSDNTITWPDDGWYQVQRANDYTSVCQGGLSCTVEPGSYIVVNHTTGERFENIEVAGDTDDSSVVVSGNTISWNDDDWYQVLSADDYAHICEGGQSCDVDDGLYIVINHTTGERFENVEVPANEGGSGTAVFEITVTGNTITWSTDGWYQVQSSSDYSTLCAGTSECMVPDGTYIVINHSTGERFEGIVVATGDTTGGGDTGGDTTPISVDPSLFVDGALASEPTIVDCTLSDGTESTCYEIITVGVPADSAVGPFCPESIYSSADDSGIWLDGTGEVYQADGDFILDLPNIYGDNTWQLYDTATGDVNITDTQEACEAAARPDVDEAYTNYCVECSLDYVDGGVSATYLIPVTPTLADSTGSIANVGVTLNGVQLAGPAPVDAILSAYTIAAFDDCGGHVNPTDGYHYHAATGCTEEADTQPDGHASMIGYAMDGYAIYGSLDSDGNETEGLDECRGITDETRGYHYHAASAGENMFIGCFSGKTASSDGGVGGGGPPGGQPPR